MITIKETFRSGKVKIWKAKNKQEFIDSVNEWAYEFPVCEYSREELLELHDHTYVKYAERIKTVLSNNPELDKFYHIHDGHEFYFTADKPDEFAACKEYLANGLRSLEVKDNKEEFKYLSDIAAHQFSSYNSNLYTYLPAEFKFLASPPLALAISKVWREIGKNITGSTHRGHLDLPKTYQHDDCTHNEEKGLKPLVGIIRKVIKSNSAYAQSVKFKGSDNDYYLH